MSTLSLRSLGSLGITTLGILSISSIFAALPPTPSEKPVGSLAPGVGGFFAQYFTNMQPGCNASVSNIITGFSSNLTPTCSAISPFMENYLKSIGQAPVGQALLGFDATGHKIFGDVNWVRNTNDISYTAGNVGIGTASPTEKLEVNGNLMINNGGAEGSRIIWRGGPGGTKEYRSRIATDGSFGLFPVETGEVGAIGSVLTLTQSGKVGIRTGHPRSPLEVVFDNEPAGIGNDFVINRFDNNNDWSPVNMMRARGTLSTPQDVQNGDWLGGIYNAARINGAYSGTSYIASQYLGDGTTNKSDFSFHTSGQRRMTINENGYVGIGTAAPLRALHVNGEFSLSRSDKTGFINVSDVNGNGGGTLWLRGLDSGGSVGTDAKIILQGNVGIGTTNPTEKLDVAGNVKIGDKVLRPGVDSWLRLGDSAGDYNGQGLAASNFWSDGWAILTNVCIGGVCRNDWPKDGKDGAAGPAGTNGANGAAGANGSGKSSGINIYQCPNFRSPEFIHDAAWASYGCQGQISTQNYCENWEYPWSEQRPCTYIGVLTIQ